MSKEIEQAAENAAEAYGRFLSAYQTAMEQCKRGCYTQSAYEYVMAKESELHAKVQRLEALLRQEGVEGAAESIAQGKKSVKDVLSNV